MSSICKICLLRADQFIVVIRKRLQFYVKEANVWEKDKTHEKIDKSIQDITFKQIKQIKKWEEKNPDYLT